MRFGQVGPFRGLSENDSPWGVSVFRGVNHLLSNSARLKSQLRLHMCSEAICFACVISLSIFPFLQLKPFTRCPKL